MKHVKPAYWWIALTAYLLGGLAMGVAQPAIRATAGNLLGRRGWGNAYLINVAMPLLAMALAMFYPRLRTVLLGAVLMTLGFQAGVGLSNGWPASPGGFFQDVLANLHPILIAGTIGCMLLGSFAAVLVRPWRRVGVFDPTPRCARCGYALIGLPEPRCPECGTPFAPARLSTPSDVTMEHLTPRGSKTD